MLKSVNPFDQSLLGEFPELDERAVDRKIVAAAKAFSTAGAATQIVGSPTPPQNPPDGITMLSTGGIERTTTQIALTEQIPYRVLPLVAGTSNGS